MKSKPMFRCGFSMLLLLVFFTNQSPIWASPDISTGSKTTDIIIDGGKTLIDVYNKVRKNKKEKKKVKKETEEKVDQTLAEEQAKRDQIIADEKAVLDRIRAESQAKEAEKQRLKNLANRPITPFVAAALSPDKTDDYFYISLLGEYEDGITYLNRMDKETLFGVEDFVNQKLLELGAVPVPCSKQDRDIHHYTPYNSDFSITICGVKP
jgi:hypothetical protein